MRTRSLILTAWMPFLLVAFGCSKDEPTEPGDETDGKTIFRYDTFGDEQFWTQTLHMNTVIETAVDPTTALAVGLKVDADALPAGFLQGADLMSPATTVALLSHDAVVGVMAVVDSGHIRSVGITCALCHSTVDDAVTSGIGHRLDGWPNRDLDPGRIIALSPAIPDSIKNALRSWGPGRYDPYFNHDGINQPVLIPPAYGLQDVALETYTGEGPISYWNSYVAVTQMHGQGSFSNPALGINIVANPDLVTPKLPALRDYQLSLLKPPAAAGSYDAPAAERGRLVFEGTAQCAQCHPAPTFTDAAQRLHEPSETGMEALYASRGVTNKYRATPLRALWQHPPYFHDGSAASLADVVEHYRVQLGFTLTTQQRNDLIEYLKSL